MAGLKVFTAACYHNILLIAVRQFTGSTELFLLNHVWSWFACFPRDRLSVGSCKAASNPPAQGQGCPADGGDFPYSYYRLRIFGVERRFVQGNRSVWVAKSLPRETDRSLRRNSVLLLSRNCMDKPKEKKKQRKNKMWGKTECSTKQKKSCPEVIPTPPLLSSWVC